MSVCNTNAINKLCQKINTIECNCECVQRGFLEPSLQKSQNALKNYFQEWVPSFKDECKKNGTFCSFKEYLEKCTDFSKPYLIYLTQSDFDVNPVTLLTLKQKLGGTLRIRHSSYFQLSENILLNFNSKHDYFPTSKQTQAKVHIPGYNQKYLYPVRQDNGAYDLGFFAGIAIETEKVVIDLNHKEIKMAPEFYLMQRFFSIIELSSSPFIPKQGPGDFGEKTSSATNTAVINGYLGLSSHHAIHGNQTKTIWIDNVKARDFEIAGISLNNSDDLLIDNCEMGPSFKKVPVKGNATTLIYINLALKKLANKNQTFANLFTQSKQLVEQMKDEFRTTGAVTIPTIGNENQLSDGLVYGIVVNRKGVAVNDFSICCPSISEELSKNVFIANTKIYSLISSPEEVVSLQKDNKVILMGFGAILRLPDMLDISTGLPIKNAFNDLIFELSDYLSTHSKCINHFMPYNLYKFPGLINWYLGRTSKTLFEVMKTNNLQLKLNADTMNHVHKGVMGLRLDGVYKGLVSNIAINNIQNSGEMCKVDEYPSELIPKELDDYDGNTCRAVAVAGCIDTIIKKSEIKKVSSSTGCAYGINFINGDKGVYTDEMKISQIITLSNEIREGNKWPESRLSVVT